MRHFVKVQVNMVIEADAGIDVEDVLGNMDYSFDSQTENADVVDTEIVEWDIFESNPV